MTAVMYTPRRPSRFLWRLTRNAICLLPGGKALLFPSDALAARFGRGDAEYAWSVFQHHRGLLDQAGVDLHGVRRILEVGPGRNLGAAVLWSAEIARRSGVTPDIICWDVFPNARVDDDGFWASLAHALAEACPPGTDPSLRAALDRLSTAGSRPVDYRVSTLGALAAREVERGFDLILSHAAIEHVWRIDAFWDRMRSLTAPGGRHSHRIDLADHGERETNYIEMLEWPHWAYWMTMRFVPGAINRWRASDHIRKVEAKGFSVLLAEPTLERSLPGSRDRLSRAFNGHKDADLRTVALDLVARRTEAQT